METPIAVMDVGKVLAMAANPLHLLLLKTVAAMVAASDVVPAGVTLHQTVDLLALPALTLNALVVTTATISSLLPLVVEETLTPLLNQILLLLLNQILLLLHQTADYPSLLGTVR